MVKLHWFTGVCQELGDLFIIYTRARVCTPTHTHTNANTHRNTTMSKFK